MRLYLFHWEVPGWPGYALVAMASDLAEAKRLLLDEITRAEDDTLDRLQIGDSCRTALDRPVAQICMAADALVIRPRNV